MVKRLFDIVVSGLLVAVLFVPGVVLALLVRLQLGTPVFFRQVRPGLHTRPFTMLKFRSMTDERGADGQLLPDAQRLTRFGRLMRASSLDELPSLLNVLKGDMSLVGPRPLLTRYLPFYTPEEMLRFKVRPGVTGLAQVNGRNALRWDDRLAMDTWYVKHQSLALDLKLLAQTVSKVLWRTDVAVVPATLMEDLDVERGVNSAHSRG